MMEGLYWFLVIVCTTLGGLVTLVCGYGIVYNISHKQPHPIIGPAMEFWYENYHVKFSIGVLCLALFMVWLKDYVGA